MLKKLILSTLFLMIFSTNAYSLCFTSDCYKKEIEQIGITYSTDNFINAIKEKRWKIVNKFIKAGIDVNAVDKSYRGNSALMWALIKKNPDLAELLIKKGANVHVVNSHGYTALQLAAVNRYKGILKILIEKGADVNVQLHERSDSGTALSWVAAGPFSPDILKLLLGAGANINARDDEGHTALYWAEVFHHGDTADFLRSRGATY